MIILDTHIWVWWVDNNARLTPKYLQWIQEYQQQGLGVSIASCWEVAKLIEKNRLIFSVSVDDWLSVALAYPRVQLISLTLLSETTRFATKTSVISLEFFTPSSY